MTKEEKIKEIEEQIKDNDEWIKINNKKRKPNNRLIEILKITNNNLKFIKEKLENENN